MSMFYFVMDVFVFFQLPVYFFYLFFYVLQNESDISNKKKIHKVQLRFAGVSTESCVAAFVCLLFRMVVIFSLWFKSVSL